MEISHSLQLSNYKRAFHEYTRVNIPNFLSKSAADLISNHLNQQKVWNLSCQQNFQHLDLNANAIDDWNEEQKDHFLTLIYSQASKNFQYLFNSIPIYDIYHSKIMPGNFFHQIYEFVNGESFLDSMRSITSSDVISFADAQATCYKRGHFLTRHDDEVKGKNRIAAYVINLTKNWNPDWGGLLQFYNQEGEVTSTYIPDFNSITIFKVPQTHAVSIVTPFAESQRLAITGWLRAN